MSDTLCKEQNAWHTLSKFLLRDLNARVGGTAGAAAVDRLLFAGGTVTGAESTADVCAPLTGALAAERWRDAQFSQVLIGQAEIIYLGRGRFGTFWSLGSVRRWFIVWKRQ